ncbi:Cyclin-dependent kinase inhibitor 3, CDKN3 [Carpediemonas membranifera]|uniref:protein-tyrosine-phosphatase n=1 Tax=Carpediemonas membranifera TaxID=201153 RepID=A0A8J6B9Y4_9EUKA|nr:Cyclin-dependent kinase inhibitor 3, CDKN3 [Carpediemonas membranifera]|eukprot:KAG9396314.1 Cyclin-dependent kinase inhibitor 3, CDKN3 [Carpediemonas membranifera]
MPAAEINTESFSIGWINTNKGRIGICEAPGRYIKHINHQRDIITDIDQLEASGARVVFSFIETEELSIYRMPSLLEDLGSKFVLHHIPTADGEVPEPLHRIVSDVIEAMVEGPVVLHCYGGLGRSATVAAAVLVTLSSKPRAGYEGHPALDAIEAVRGVRGSQAVQTVRQWNALFEC